MDPGRSGCDFQNIIFHPILLIFMFRFSHDNALKWMPWDIIDDKSKLVQVMAWCHQATNHYLSSCWPRCKSPYGITRLQWVKSVLTGNTASRNGSIPSRHPAISWTNVDSRWTVLKNLEKSEKILQRFYTKRSSFFNRPTISNLWWLRVKNFWWKNESMNFNLPLIVT